MNNRMMAAVLYGKENLQVEPVAVPTIESGDILVRVKVALTCGTDLKVFRRGYHAKMIVPPAVFGHELANDEDPPSSQRGSNRYFLLASCRTRQHQIRDVGATDQQHQCDRAQQHQKRSSDRA